MHLPCQLASGAIALPENQDTRIPGYQGTKREFDQTRVLFTGTRGNGLLATIFPWSPPVPGWDGVTPKSREVLDPSAPN
jgi:hypothetical protein